MLPPDAFHDLVDLGVTFDVLQSVEPGWTNVYRVAPAPRGLLHLKAGVVGDDLDTMWTGPARGVISTINVLLLREWGLANQGVQLPVDAIIDEGKVCEYEIRPTGSEATRRRLKPFRVESEVLYADLPDRVARDVVVTIDCLGRKSLHLLRTADTPGLFPVERLSPNALPFGLHARLAAKGHYRDSFVALNGRAALIDAQIESKAERSIWQSRAAAAARGRPHPDVHANAANARPAATPSGQPTPAVGLPEDGRVPYAFVHKVKTSWGSALVRSEGTVTIPSAAPGAEAAFVGEFFVPKHSTIPRPALTPLAIHAVGDGLYSRLAPMLGSLLPTSFGKASELADILAWKRQPKLGIDGHPFVQALREFRADIPRELADHVCPPGWDVVYHGGERQPNFTVAALYGGLAGLSGREKIDYLAYLRNHKAKGPPEILQLDAQDTKLERKVQSAADALAREISAAVEGQIALVDGEVMLRTHEPCWKLTLAKGGDLRLDLHLGKYLATGTNLEPTLFFAIDDEESRDAAIESLLAGSVRSGLRTRGRLDAFDASACRIDGPSTSLTYLAQGLRESLHHAAKVLPGEASRAALAFRESIATDLPASIMGFQARDGVTAALPANFREGWERLADLAGEAIDANAASPWLARLAGHGAVLELLAERPVNVARPAR